MTPTGRLAALFFVLLLSPPPAQALVPVFLDGFESCGASAWSAATGLPACSAPLACPAQIPGKACVAGRILDAETSAPLCASPVTTATCTASSEGGACALVLRVYDALEFLGNPGGATPLVPIESVVDGCGRFRLNGFPKPAFGYSALTLDDAGDAGDARALSAATLPIPDQAQIEARNLYAVAHTTDEAWTTTAGSPFGADTFVDRGVFAPIFLHAGVPVAGVTSTTNGIADAGTDFYFSDAAPTRRAIVDVNQNSTGANGSALIAVNTLSDRSGTGSEPPGCSWPSASSGSAPGLAMVIEISAVVTGQPQTPCP